MSEFMNNFVRKIIRNWNRILALNLSIILVAKLIIERAHVVMHRGQRVILSNKWWRRQMNVGPLLLHNFVHRLVIQIVNFRNARDLQINTEMAKSLAKKKDDWITLLHFNKEKLLCIFHGKNFIQSFYFIFKMKHKLWDLTFFFFHRCRKVVSAAYLNVQM